MSDSANSFFLPSQLARITVVTFNVGWCILPNGETIMDSHTDSEFMASVVDGVKRNDPRGYQIDPDEKDPVCGETADDAWGHYKKTGLVNPAHAVELQRRQSEERRKARENESSLAERVLDAYHDDQESDE